VSDPFLGEIRMFGFNFAPQGWAFCNGQTMSISQFDAVFALLGTTYGGNGVTTFQLPNLQSRVPIHLGQGNGLSPYVLGELGGLENVTLTIPQMPAHNHLITADTNPLDTLASNPSGHWLSPTGDNVTGAKDIYSRTDPLLGNATTMHPQMVNVAGGSQPHPNIQPFLVLNFCIALVGIFPSRN
jgi:microcystin-dependent protein